jgi:hypothetical protein
MRTSLSPPLSPAISFPAQASSSSLSRSTIENDGRLSPLGSIDQVRSTTRRRAVSQGGPLLKGGPTLAPDITS